MKRYLAIFVLTIALVMGGWFFRGRTPSSPPPEKSVAGLPPWINEKKAVQLAVVKTIAANIDEQKDTPTQYRRYLDLYRNSRRSLFADEEREVFLSQAARNPELIRWSRILLEKPAEAKNLLGEDQAEGRILAIQILRANAIIFGPAELESTLRAVSARLQASRFNPAGEKRDLEDLLASYTSLKPEETFRELGAVLGKIGYQESLRPQIVTGIYLGLKDRYPKEEIEKLLRHYQLLEGSH